MSQIITYRAVVYGDNNRIVVLEIEAYESGKSIGIDFYALVSTFTTLNAVQASRQASFCEALRDMGFREASMCSDLNPENIRDDVVKRITECYGDNVVYDIFQTSETPLFRNGVLKNAYDETLHICSNTPGERLNGNQNIDNAFLYDIHPGSGRRMKFQFEVIDFLAGGLERINQISDFFSDMKIGENFRLNEIISELEDRKLHSSTVLHFFIANLREGCFERIAGDRCKLVKR